MSDEGALARTLGLPTLVLVQEDVKRRVVFDMNFAGYLGLFKPDADVTWLHDQKFLVPFGYWKDALEERVDVFLGDRKPVETDCAEGQAVP